LKRHTALIKRIRQSLAADNRDQILKDIESLSLEKYIDEIAGAIIEGVARCKTEKDVWAAVEVRFWSLHCSIMIMLMTRLGDILFTSAVSEYLYPSSCVSYVLSHQRTKPGFPECHGL
jgi:hypothetical protein